MRAVFDHSSDEAKNIKTFYFKPDEPLKYTAGQFAEWILDHPKPDNRGVKRWFTISSSPTDSFVAVTTKIAAAPSTFMKALLNMQPGDEIVVRDAMGDFVLPKLIQTPLVFVAGGIGITPFHSIFTWLKAVGETRPIKLIYGVNTEDEILFDDLISKIGIDATIVVKEPSSAWGGERGELTAELIMGLGRPSDDTLVYVSGPEPMVEKLQKDLRHAGLKPNQFVGDSFPNYKAI